MKKTVTDLKVNNTLINSDGSIKKQRVAVYARVSTIRDLQRSSYELQIATYHNKILENPLWDFAGVFADYGKSGTSMASRAEFLKMIELARLGKIDLILTKSISRFTRDIVGGLETIYKLREYGVDVLFEKENIKTSDSSFDFFLSIYTSVSEEEAKQTSGNVLWSYKNKMKAGSNTTSRLYGYTFNNDGEYIINPDQAPAVKAIFDMYLEDKTLKEIIDYLESSGYKTYKGSSRFSVGALNRILRNEKYAGDMLLQKTTTVKLGSRRSVKNTTKDKYYVSNNHEPIVTKKIFRKVQRKIAARAAKYKSKSETRKIPKYSKYVYSIIGNKYYKSKTNHRKTNYEVKLLELLDSNRNRILEAKNIYYSQIDIALEHAVNWLRKNKRSLGRMFNDELKEKLASSDIKKQLLKMKKERKTVYDEGIKIQNSDINIEAKNEIIKNINTKIKKINNKVVSLDYQLITKYSYKENMQILLSKIRDADFNIETNFKDIFSKIIAIDRENLILCIHLSNRNIDKIDLKQELVNNSIYSSNFNFQKSRLLLEVSWKIIII